MIGMIGLAKAPAGQLFLRRPGTAQGLREGARGRQLTAAMREAWIGG